MRKHWRVARRVIVPPKITAAEGDCLRDAIGDAGLPWVPGAAGRSPQTTWMEYGDRMSAIGRTSGVTAFMRRRMPVGNDLRQAAWNAVVAGMAELRASLTPKAPPTPDIPDEWLVAYVNAGGGGAGSFKRFCEERGFTYPAVPAGPSESLADDPSRDAAPPSRRPLPTGPRLPPAPSCDPGAPLVIRRRGEAVPHG